MSSAQPEEELSESKLSKDKLSCVGWWQAPGHWGYWRRGWLATGGTDKIPYRSVIYESPKGLIS